MDANKLYQQYLKSKKSSNLAATGLMSVTRSIE
jgi:hypothetical protein